MEKWRLEKMEKEKWMQEFEKKQSRKRGYEEDEEDVGEGEDDKDSQFFKLADTTLMRMTSKDDHLDRNQDDDLSSNVFKPKQNDKVFKSPSKFGPLQPLQNMVSKNISALRTTFKYFLSRVKQFVDPSLPEERSLWIRLPSSTKSRMTEWAVE